MAGEAEVRKASEEFYSALSRMTNGDAGPLANIWSHNAEVTTMHPIGGREVGRDEVRGSWEQVAELCSAGKSKNASRAWRSFTNASASGNECLGFVSRIHRHGLSLLRRFRHRLRSPASIRRLSQAVVTQIPSYLVTVLGPAHGPMWALPTFWPASA